MSVYKSADFESETPPPRIVGTEMEYVSTQLENNVIEAKKVVKVARELTGSTNREFVRNGSRIYLEVNQALEVATAECLSAEQVMFAEIAGQLTVAEAIRRYSEKTRMNLYRRTGTGHLTLNHITLGYHQNLLTLRYKSEHEQQQAADVIASYLDTRVVWSGSGMVDQTYVLSQKAKDLSLTNNTVQVGNRSNPTQTGAKPMLTWSRTVRRNGRDVSSGPMAAHAKGWERLELRHADAVHSPWARKMGIATASLVLRLYEHKDYFHPDFWKSVTLAHIPDASRKVSTDLSMKDKYKLLNGKEVTALDHQSRLAEAALWLSERIKLPNDEKLAAIEWIQICDDLREVDFTKPETLVAVADRVEWAARYVMLIKYLGKKGFSQTIDRSNRKAVGFDSMWDQLVPTSIADTYWKRHQPFNEDQLRSIEVLKTVPPDRTRALVRGQLISENPEYSSADWAFFQSETHGRKNQFNDPYDYRIQRAS